MRESASASHIRLDAAQLGVDLWRNNSGAFQDDTGRWVFFGLDNTSSQKNKLIKSLDYVGITPLFIMPEHVGTVIGVYTEIETKESDWTFPQPTNKKEYDHCVAQQRRIDLVLKAHGYAGFARDVPDFRRIIKR